MKTIYVLAVLLIVGLSYGALAQNSGKGANGQPFQQLWDAFVSLQEKDDSLQDQVNDLEARVAALEGQSPPDGTPCDDGNLCTSSDEYTNGVCAGVAISCDDGDSCTIDSCDVNTGSCTYSTEPSCMDNDADGYSVGQGDCNDFANDINPGATEVCDAIDNNCDGFIDEGISQVACDGDDLDSCEEGITSCVGGVLTCSDTSGDNLEMCNGLDDDCDGTVDDGDLCLAPNAVGICQGVNECQYTCEPGFYNCDATPDCESTIACGSCLPIGPEPNDGCINAINLGTLDDNAGDVISSTGNLHDAGDSDWYMFLAMDSPGLTEEFSVDGRFLSNPGASYRLEVYKGTSCGNMILNNVDAWQQSSFQDYGSLAVDDTYNYFVRVYSDVGSSVCDPYTLQLSNGFY